MLIWNVPNQYKIDHFTVLCSERLWNCVKTKTVNKVSGFIHSKAVEQYFTVELSVNPLTLRVKPWVIQRFF